MADVKMMNVGRMEGERQEEGREVGGRRDRCVTGREKEEQRGIGFREKRRVETREEGFCNLYVSQGRFC